MMKESLEGTYTIGEGSKKQDKVRLMANISCSKNESVPSKDCTQIKSLPFTDPKGPMVSENADLAS